MMMNTAFAEIMGDNIGEPSFRDYTFKFEAILNSNGLVKFIDHFHKKEESIGFIVNDEEFSSRVETKFPSIIADLIDLAVAIYASDRLAVYNLERTQRRIYVFLPLGHPELFNGELLQSKLNELLIWTTGSQWSFEFTKRQVSGRFVEQQPLLLSTMTPDSEVALWSGGLDSLAGLYTRLQTTPDQPFTLFGTGSNNIIYSYQGKIAEKVQSIFPNRISLLRVPIHFNNSSQQNKNKLSRVRGVLFTLLGSACAYLMGQKKLFVYENGIGAINLPYSKSTVGLDNSRSVHPQTLLMVSDLVSELVGERFEIKNPFLFWTKAQMCEALAKDSRNNLSSSTVSCDSRHRKKITFQCGYCSSCLLRRQALLAANIRDETRYVITHGEHPSKKDPSLYFRHMQAQVNTLDRLFQVSNKSDIQWKYLTQEFIELDDIVDRTFEAEGLSASEMRNSLIQLYQTYVYEWKAVEFHLQKRLLNSA
ncbi:7-cyano-7-deazaguanine synthase [Ancylothrix sp. C2]|uniref:7-cyano-7-deazaguanine synthase n=1 Tax=Ancylothrix sp. D3o TaxID=2953691 RepID=UPI0021BA8609|nr:7-cyano-7-deazaguanine synthase [Ancylothrix sp. D3o]MCT7952892.1 7-cyano-7-deazaguanine synthase [Ancylothrix sp. D3o]